MPRVVDPDETPIAYFPDEDCYRIVERSVEKTEVAGQEVAVEVAEHGDRVVWIDDAPGNIEDGSGHWEVYAKTHHGDEYNRTMPNPDGLEE
jgi:hypothetical protein